MQNVIEKANKEGYAVGAFNTINLETTHAIIQAAKEMRSPAVIQITEKTMEYAGGRAIFHLVKNEAHTTSSDIPGLIFIK